MNERTGASLIVAGLMVLVSPSALFAAQDCYALPLEFSFCPGAAGFTQAEMIHSDAESAGFDLGDLWVDISAVPDDMTPHDTTLAALGDLLVAFILESAEEEGVTPPETPDRVFVQTPEIEGVIVTMIDEYEPGMSEILVTMLARADDRMLFAMLDAKGSDALEAGALLDHMHALAEQLRRPDQEG